MDLKAAIKAAVRFAEKAKADPTVLQYVRFLPQSGDAPARLCAQTPRCGIVVFLDHDVPNTLVRADLLQNAIKDVKFGIDVEPAAYGGVQIRSGKTTWTVPPADVPQLGWYPEVPLVPSEFRAIDGDAIERVVHAASKDGDRPNLQTVHFQDGVVEATDKARFARAPISGQWQGLLPVEVFQRLPRGELKAAFTLRLAYLRCEDEVRFAPYVGLPYPDCKALIPEIHEGNYATTSVPALVRAVKQAIAVSETGSVNLKFEVDRIVLSTWKKREQDPELFEAIAGARTAGEGQILVMGKNLAASLKSVRTPCVRLGYARPMDPLRLESAGYLEVLWPMLA